MPQTKEKSPLGLEHKYENYWEILKYNHDMIRFSELKAGLVISILGVLFSLLLQSLDTVKAHMEESWIVAVVAIVFVGLTLVAVIFSFKCFIPRFENKNPTSVIFFGDIVSDFPKFNDYHEYIQKMMINEHEFSLQLAEQIHTNASIALRKFKLVSKSIRFLLWALLFLIILVCTILFIS